jgi:hypothetical protein
VPACSDKPSFKFSAGIIRLLFPRADDRFAANTNRGYASFHLLCGVGFVSFGRGLHERGWTVVSVAIIQEKSMRNSILKSLLLSGFIWAMAVSQVNAGYVVRLIYENITGSAVSNLTSNPIFPTDFTSQENIGNTLDTNGMYVFESPSYAYGDNYGSWTRGYFEAPTNGAYTFWLATDDASELWLSTDTTVGNKK